MSFLAPGKIADAFKTIHSPSVRERGTKRKGEKEKRKREKEEKRKREKKRKGENERCVKGLVSKGHLI